MHARKSNKANRAPTCGRMWRNGTMYGMLWCFTIAVLSLWLISRSSQGPRQPEASFLSGMRHKSTSVSIGTNCFRSTFWGLDLLATASLSSMIAYYIQYQAIMRILRYASKKSGLLSAAPAWARTGFVSVSYKPRGLWPSTPWDGVCPPYSSIWF